MYHRVRHLCQTWFKARMANIFWGDAQFYYATFDERLASTMHITSCAEHGALCAGGPKLGQRDRGHQSGNALCTAQQAARQYTAARVFESSGSPTATSIFSREQIKAYVRLFRCSLKGNEMTNNLEASRRDTSHLWPHCDESFLQDREACS